MGCHGESEIPLKKEEKRTLIPAGSENAVVFQNERAWKRSFASGEHSARGSLSLSQPTH
jgi:hypothetical protein